MSAKQYNEVRRIVFSTANNPNKGFSVARSYMEETYSKKLDTRSYKGLMAELNFYEKYRKEFGLTVAGDMGEHADFAGTFGSQTTRFDVTTNINYKNFRDYEPYLGEGIAYKIALMDHKNFEIIDVFDLAFKRCDCCGGYLIPSIILLNQNYNDNGYSKWDNDQLLIETCTDCEEIIEKERYTHNFLLSAQEYYSSFDDNDLADESTEKYLVSTYKYFRRSFDDSLMAVGSKNYVVTEQDGGGEWQINFNFINSAVSESLPRSIEIDSDFY